MTMRFKEILRKVAEAVKAYIKNRKPQPSLPKDEDKENIQRIVDFLEAILDLLNWSKKGDSAKPDPEEFQRRIYKRLEEIKPDEELLLKISKILEEAQRFDKDEKEFEEFLKYQREIMAKETADDGSQNNKEESTSSDGKAESERFLKFLMELREGCKEKK